MTSFNSGIVQICVLGLAIAVFLALYKFWLRFLGIVIIPDNAIGLVTKKFVVMGRNRQLPPGRIIALNGEAGFQADTLAPGVHYWLWPWQYTVEKRPFFEVPQGQIGFVESCDGVTLTGGRVVAKCVECDSFQDARAFLSNGGQRGPQALLMPPGKYRINTLAQTVRQSLAQAQALADTQPQVVAAERKVSIAEFDAKAFIAKAEGDARSKTINAAADAEVTRVTGEATAARTLAVGSADAKIIELKVKSMESGNYAAVQVAEALSRATQRIVPEIVASGGGTDGASGSLINVLLADLLVEKRKGQPPI
jgi:uncharacterized membrane protein YqiK